MDKDKAVTWFIKVLYTLSITCMIGKWGIYMAYTERGYQAVGGEYILILITCWTAWKTINYLFDTLEDLKYERNCKKRRSGGASWLRDNR